MDVPTHLGIIMDGNRRFSKRLMRKPWKGHEWGRDKLREVIGWVRVAGIRMLTVYAFSMQNFNRPREEFDALMRIMREYAQELAADPDSLRNEGVRVRFVGRVHLLPADVRDAMHRLEDVTEGNGPFTLNVAVAYGGREELLDGFRSIAAAVAQGTVAPTDIDADMVSSSLQVRSEPDMIIRTGGEHRTSNFLVWQSWYSEWFFTDTLWPEFSKEEFLNCLARYGERTRRFGR